MDWKHFPPLTRRELFRAGGLGVAGYFIQSAYRPWNVQAAGGETCAGRTPGDSARRARSARRRMIT